MIGSSQLMDVHTEKSFSGSEKSVHRYSPRQAELLVLHVCSTVL